MQFTLHTQPAPAHGLRCKNCRDDRGAMKHPRLTKSQRSALPIAAEECASREGGTEQTSLWLQDVALLFQRPLTPPRACVLRDHLSVS